MRLWKVLSEDGASCHGGDAKWSLPRDSRPGEWMPKRDPVLCVSGYHLCRDEDLVHWLGPRIWRAEASGEILVGDDKVCAERVRLVAPTVWDEPLARRFAALCAWRALCRERRAGREPHADSWVAVRAALAHSRGEIGGDELAAARDAAWAAARDAAWAAAGDAARAAAGAAERAAQTRILLRVIARAAKEG